MLVVQSILLCYGIDLLEYLKSILGRYLCNGETSDLEEEKIIEIISQQSCACTLDENGLKFWPPLYMQRYMTIQEVIEHPIWNGSIKKVVDFGCSEMGLFKCIKPIPGLNNIMLVDVDFDTLDINQFKVLPTNYDYVSMYQRKEPLTVDIYNGSIADQDDRMLGVDAVICIELIEHLYLDVLELLPNNVFEFIKPKLAVFTTPNVEFNILFPNFTTQFRHDDHKFEWTRKQFKEWAKKIITRYPEYAVQIDGIGAGPSGTENIGCCSQMAIFYRKDMTTSPVKPIDSTPYKLLRRIDYPYALEENLRDWPLINKLRQFISDASSNKKYIVGDNMRIPLNEIMPYLSDCCSSIDKLEDIARKLYYTEKNDHGEWLLVTAMPGFGSDECESDSDSLLNISGQEYHLSENIINLDDDNEDWNTSVVLSSDKSKLCYSTPMTRNLEFQYYSSNVDSFSTVHSNSDLYKTAVDFNKSKDIEDMEMSSSCNSSIDEDCKVYHGFRTGQNNSGINEEDINETENTLTGNTNSHAFSNNGDKLNYHSTNDMEISSSYNGSIIVEDCTVYRDFKSGRNNSVTKEEDINEIENTLACITNSHAFSNNGDKLNYHSTNDMEISSSYNGSIIVEDCTVYRDFKSGRNNSVTKEEDINEIENTLTCIANSRTFSNDGNKLNENIINGNTTIKNNSNLSLKLKCSSDTAHQFKSYNPDETYTTTNDGVNEIDNQLTVCLDRTLLDESGYTENLLSTSDNQHSKK